VFTRLASVAWNLPLVQKPKRSNRNHESQNVMSSARAMTRHANNGQANKSHCSRAQS